jgi:hypothetical protein
MTGTGALLAAYDEQMRQEPPSPQAGVTYGQDGPVLRVVGQYRGFVSAPRDVGVRGPNSTGSSPGSATTPPRQDAG